MNVSIYLRNMDSEYPIKVLREKSEKYWEAKSFGFDQQQYWQADWAAPWQGEYRRGYTVKEMTENVNHTSIIKRISRLTSPHSLYHFES